MDDLFNDIRNAAKVKIVLMKTGYSTHAINFGMRMAELDHSFTVSEQTTRGANNSTETSITGVTLHVCQAPPNVAILPPGTAWFFVVVDGVPSVGVRVMVGTGVIGDQPTSDVEALPEGSTIIDTQGGGGKSAAGSVVWGREDGVKSVFGVVIGLVMVQLMLLS